MTIRSVCYCSEAKATSLHITGACAVISITDCGRKAALQKGWSTVIRVEFDDAEYDERSLKFAGIDWWIASGAISPQQAIFLRQNIHGLHESQEDVDLIIHCHAGQSRSAAVAAYVADRYGVKHLQERSPKANKTVYALLNNPWCLVSEADFQKKMLDPVMRTALRIKRWLSPRRTESGAR